MKLRNSISVGIVFLLMCVPAVSWFVFKKTIAAEVVETQYFVRIAAVYEGNIDNRYYITSFMLDSIAPSFVGLPILLAHNWGNPNMCVGRIIESAVKSDEFGHYVEIVALINNPDTALLIARDAYHSVSIGFTTDKEICLIDNKDPRDCMHEPGNSYKINGKWIIARMVPQQIVMHEVSFINVPASAHARILEFATHRLTCK